MNIPETTTYFIRVNLYFFMNDSFATNPNDEARNKNSHENYMDDEQSD